jgi:hypothetical protein
MMLWVVKYRFVLKMDINSLLVPRALFNERIVEENVLIINFSLSSTFMQIFFLEAMMHFSNDNCRHTI